MILVDTSIWIELLSGRVRGIGPEQLTHFCTCGPVVQEVLQGLRPGPDSEEFRHSILALPFLFDPIPRSAYLHAAQIYREGRRRGYTIRSSVDCLIAAIAIDSGSAVWHRDRDYRNIAKLTSLIQFPGSVFPH